MTTVNPLVSVVMPAFNREHTVSESIQSVINQQYQNWELLVVDDRSIDKTEYVVKSFTNIDKRIKYLKNELSQGPAGARNFGIANAKGAYIAFLDSDDLWLPQHLKDCINVLQEHNLNFCSAKWYEKKNNKLTPSAFVNSIDFLIKTFPLNKEKTNCIIFDSNIFEFLMTKDLYPFHISTIVINKAVLDKVGRFDEKLFGPEDSDLIFRVILEYGMCILDDFHSIWVEGDDNIHFFKDDNADYESKIIPRIIRNRVNHIRLFKKQVALIRTNKHRFSDYKHLINLKRYEVAFNCKCLSRLCRNRNIKLYYRLRVDAFIYHLLTSNSLLKYKNQEWKNLLRPRVLFEGLPRTYIQNLQTTKNNWTFSKQALSANRSNFWLYFEKDVQILIKGDLMTLFNRKTKVGISFSNIHQKLSGIQSNYVLLNRTSFLDKQMSDFLEALDTFHLGGLVDVIDSQRMPISLISTQKHTSKWI